MTFSLYRTIADTRRLDRSDALRLTDQIEEIVINVLRRDPAMPPLSFLEWQLAFAPAKTRIAEQINKKINGHDDLDAVLATVDASFDFRE